MKKKERIEYLSVLELSGNASNEDIHEAYKYLIEMYTSEDSLELIPLRGEITREKKEKIIENITTAYEKLTSGKKKEVSEVDISYNPPEFNIELDHEITGKYLKARRESRGLKIREIQDMLKISYKDIVHIENERFDKLADPGYLRWLVSLYSKFLGVDEKKGAEDFMRRYRSTKKSS